MSSSFSRSSPPKASSHRLLRPSRMPSALRKLLSLDPRSLADLIAAQSALLRARRLLKRQPIGSLTIRDAGVSPRPDGDPARARAVALAVSRAAAYGLFRPKCLVRAIALRELLGQHGVSGSEIRVGVRQRKGQFNAHAWVRWGDEILGDQPDHVATFTEVDDIRVLEGSGA